MRSRNYVIIFVLIMTAIVAVVLAGMNTALAGVHDKNEALYNRKAILSSVQDKLGFEASKLSAEEVDRIFAENIDQIVLKSNGERVEGVVAEELDMAKESKKPTEEMMLPLYVYEEAGSKFYIVSVRGVGLWDAIWGNIALEGDLNTIAGVSFDHAGETPGLGAEIKDNPAFPAMFVGKEIYNSAGDYVSVDVVKGSLSSPKHQVQAISGATITSNGVGDMLIEDIALYLPYFETETK